MKLLPAKRLASAALGLISLLLIAASPSGPPAVVQTLSDLLARAPQSSSTYVVVMGNTTVGDTPIARFARWDSASAAAPNGTNVFPTSTGVGRWLLYDTLSPSQLLGRTDASEGPAQAITVGAGLQISGTTLSSTAVGAGAGTNLIVNGVLIQPAIITNDVNIVWTTNANGHIYASITNFTSGVTNLVDLSDVSFGSTTNGQVPYWYNGALTNVGPLSILDSKTILSGPLYFDYLFDYNVIVGTYDGFQIEPQATVSFTGVGPYAGDEGFGLSGSVAVGDLSMYKATNLVQGIGIGESALREAQNSQDLTAIGTFAGSESTNSNFSVFIGRQAGYRVSATNSVFLGYSAGTNRSSSLVIDSWTSRRTNPLIYGEFDNRLLVVNSNLLVTGSQTNLGSIRAAGPTVVDSTPILSLSQTWNDGTEAFTGLLLNVTNTASSTNSLLQDWQVGGASVASVRYDGALTIGNRTTTNGLMFRRNASGSDFLYTRGNFYLMLDEDATSSANEFSILNTGFGVLLTVVEGGDVSVGTGELTIASGTTTTDDPALAITQTFNAAAVDFTAARINVTDTASTNTSKLLDLQVGSVSQMNVRKDGQVTAASFVGSGAGLTNLPVNMGSTIFRFTALDNQPGTNSSGYATFDVRGDGMAVLDFDVATAEDARFPGIMPQGVTSTNILVRLLVVPTFEVATSNLAVFGTSFANMTNGFPRTWGTSNTLSVTFATNTVPQWITITNTGAGIGAGDPFTLKVYRQVGAPNTVTNDVELLLVEGRVL